LLFLRVSLHQLLCLLLVSLFDLLPLRFTSSPLHQALVFLILFFLKLLPLLFLPRKQLSCSCWYFWSICPALGLECTKGGRSFGWTALLV
jgi:hypothetical protein